MCCDFFKHFKTVCKHKYWVFRYSLLAGIPIRGLVHDLSKFSPTEFLTSVEYYTGKQSPVNVERNLKQYSTIWLHHRGRNPHHFEYWVDKRSVGKNFSLVVVPMPFKYALEMICDWLGAGRAYLGKDFSMAKQVEFFDTATFSPFIHPQTKEFVRLMYEELLKAQDKQAEKEVFKMAEDLYARAWDIVLTDTKPINERMGVICPVMYKDVIR